jgi:7-cyano-7-deazaguanine synthase
MDKNAAMGAAMTKGAALVLFSGGQDSTTVLAWALSQFEHVETIGFLYGQKHAVEIVQRPTILSSLSKLNDWSSRLGPDHIIKLDLIEQIATSIAPSAHVPFGKRYIPGRNLIMLSMSASVAIRRDIRTLACGASETEYSGYPDCRRASMTAAAKAISQSSGIVFEIECPLMDLNKAGVWNLAQSLGGDALVRVIREETHTCYEGSRTTLHQWGYGCSQCAACRLREKGWKEFTCSA